MKVQNICYVYGACIFVFYKKILIKIINDKNKHEGLPLNLPIVKWCVTLSDNK